MPSGAGNSSSAADGVASPSGTSSLPSLRHTVYRVRMVRAGSGGGTHIVAMAGAVAVVASVTVVVVACCRDVLSCCVVLCRVVAWRGVARRGAARRGVVRRAGVAWRHSGVRASAYTTE